MPMSLLISGGRKVAKMYFQTTIKIMVRTIKVIRDDIMGLFYSNPSRFGYKVKFV